MKQEPAANIAQPSSIDPFQEVLKSMAKARKDSPAATSTPPPIAARSPVATGLTKLGKKKKTVTWPSDDRLATVCWIEKAVYDDDPVDVSIACIISVQNLISGSLAGFSSQSS